MLVARVMWHLERKLHGVNHAKKHGREVFTPRLIAFEPIRKRIGNCFAYYLDYMSGHFQTHSHRPKNTLNLYHKNVSFPQSVYLSLGPTEEGLWLFNISVNMDRPIIGHLQ